MWNRNNQKSKYFLHYSTFWLWNKLTQLRTNVFDQSGARNEIGPPCTWYMVSGFGVVPICITYMLYLNGCMVNDICMYGQFWHDETLDYTSNI